MKTNHLLKLTSIFIASTMMYSAQAASISFDQLNYTAAQGQQISVTVNYDFTDITAFGGGFNVIYDTSSLAFVSYEQSVFMPGTGYPQNNAASPLGALESPGNYLNAGVGSFDLHDAIFTAGSIGTFVFTVLGPGPGDAGCGGALCLTPVDVNPMNSPDFGDITHIVFDNPGISATVSVVPVPAALWFLLSGVTFLLGVGKPSSLKSTV